MDLRPGYKQTEIGPIPEDWDAVPLGDLFTFKNGLNKAKKYFGYGTPIVNYMDVFRHPGLRLDRIEGRVDVSKSELEAFEVRKGDVFFTRTSETVEEIGVAAAMLDPAKDTVFSGFVLRARPTDDRLDDLFKAYCFSPRYFRRQVVARATYTTRALTNGRSLSAAFLAVPPMAEQKVIAEALSDIDAAIRNTADLIAKKRDVRSGALQRLLYGEIRLPEFTAPWQTKLLGELATIRGQKTTGASLPTGTPCVELDQIASGSGRLLSTGTASGMSIKNRFEPGDVLFGRLRAYLRKFWLADRVGVCSTEIWPLVPIEGHSTSGFVFYTIQRSDFIDAATQSYGTHMPRSDWGVVQNFEVLAPEPNEQAAIVRVLSDMDDEITALEARLEKTRALKQGMMQALLTGRVRLPVQREALDALEVAHA